jgi:hypothetical protein
VTRRTDGVPPSAGGTTLDYPGHYTLPSVPGHSAIESTPMDIDHEAVIRCSCGRAFVGSTWRVDAKYREHFVR